MGRVRVRQHVNPLAQKFQDPVKLPDWQRIYADLSQPLHLDIGCGRGRLLWQLAQLEPHWNFLGLEIREPLVIEANQWRDDKQLKNLHYLFCNVNHALSEILQSLPPFTLKRVSILCPDPWFKNRHQRRRIVQPKLVNCLADYLTPQAEVILQSDIESVAEEMCDRFSEHSAFQRLGDTWLPETLLPLTSERERAILSREKPVYRALFQR
ncbi:MAG: tRNA (guanosine(46)-N7)-methyltransferase TrmB [Oscillatoriales cyanobacterium RM1_1_9]|nr:tRNA (guanosine(46)-N7)-methyltransferase TrmB [Oscillatoriales cyanobacterium SM2_3_0]NJO44709.1 tRNA (guanosine(46)-N7)-methyltransferase TrmB [Oscillatoriales cyanobacterium RM2_1_1]NJO71794.1 tRNA (guanosine(46)-N7)-methyltransferase TrmB [Oscillatoriales cyanobacterium RM1_1_9]